ncbi:hypothetical protein [Vitiosangium sp. GDMCC 1.1324]|uniref:hypothetical protein n=1 Tax=Vitiosangium sp. (strain GDMCC 1.1324) TaxID=2138576 RepID=UPI000D39FBB3|nr:hypothetical protein [Vitiosangium sp. GDMCC 1.1324]PTL75422.1 hypothetical protein DAT35_54895 [Vitiosangium sp. GDMCC 1.1324]
MEQPLQLTEQRAEVLATLGESRLSWRELSNRLPGRPMLWRTVLWLVDRRLVLRDTTVFGEFLERTSAGAELLAAHRSQPQRHARGTRQGPGRRPRAAGRR